MSVIRDKKIVVTLTRAPTKHELIKGPKTYPNQNTKKFKQRRKTPGTEDRRTQSETPDELSAFYVPGCISVPESMMHVMNPRRCLLLPSSARSYNLADIKARFLRSAYLFWLSVSGTFSGISLAPCKLTH